MDRRRASSSETAAAKYQRSEVMSLPAVPEGAVTCCPARASRSGGGHGQDGLRGEQALIAVGQRGEHPRGRSGDAAGDAAGLGAQGAVLLYQRLPQGGELGGVKPLTIGVAALEHLAFQLHHVVVQLTVGARGGGEPQGGQGLEDGFVQPGGGDDVVGLVHGVIQQLNLHGQLLHLSLDVQRLAVLGGPEPQSGPGPLPPLLPG